MVAWLNLPDRRNVLAELHRELANTSAIVCEEETIALWRDGEYWYEIRGCNLFRYDSPRDLSALSKRQRDTTVTHVSYDLISLDEIAVETASRTLFLSWGTYSPPRKFDQIFTKVLEWLLPDPPTEIVFTDEAMFDVAVEYLHTIVPGSSEESTAPT
ncbi:hypothetical protein C440_06727 [Haloferax mucosum ATCC BAA-1512]|uniref:Uncharacterized protein n=2 Tax=Haloferax mucosum TaxID=403181 RepID=M0IKI1_9EURY|nr:hypothetical protein C440_06727 [Haloferax mucosum ATCC BAA-1512]